MHSPASARPGTVCGAYSAPSAITSASPPSVCSPTRAVFAAGSIALTSPRTNSIPCRAACLQGREIASASRSPTISQSGEGGKACCASRSTSTTRSVGGGSRRSSCAATMPPSPAPSISAVRPMAILSEDERLVGPGGPLGEFVQRAAMRALDQVGLGDAARVEAGGADTDLAVAAHHRAEHVADVVVALRHLLPGLGAGRGVAHQEHAHLAEVLHRQVAREAQRVVAALGSVRRIVQYEQGFHGCLAKKGNSSTPRKVATLRGSRQFGNPISSSPRGAGV